MSVKYDSIFYNEIENNNENSNKNAHIKERLSLTTIAYITRLKQHVQNIDIHLYGSVTNFTYFKNKSDLDCYIIYPDEYTKDKLTQFIREDSIQFHIKRIKVQQLKLSSLDYKDEFADVYCVYFDNGDKIDINIISKDAFVRLKKKVFELKDYFSKLTVTILHKTNNKDLDS